MAPGFLKLLTTKFPCSRPIGEIAALLFALSLANASARAATYALSVSTNSNHSGAVALQGATLSGPVYIFTSLASQLTNFDPPGITQVCYWLDNPAMIGTAAHCEIWTPYDFAGSVSTSPASLGIAWPTQGMNGAHGRPNGTHTMTQAVVTLGGGAEVDTATFKIDNVTATLTASPASITSGSSSTLAWTTSGATSTSIDQGIGGVALSGTLGVLPTATTTYTVTATGAGGNTAAANATVTVANGADTNHYLYVFPDQSVYVFDMDNNFKLVKQVSIPQAQGIRGVGVALSQHMLYISYGGDGAVCDYPPCSLPPSASGSLLAYDLLTDTVAWTKNYTFGIDSFSITPDGNTIYMPDGELSGDGTWYVIGAANGSVLGSINSGMNGPHNTIVSLDGSTVFLGPAFSDYLVEASTATNAATLDVGPTLSGNDIGVRPFTINGKHTLAYTTARNYLGFQVSDTGTGKVLYTVPVNGFPTAGNTSIPSHGISLSPDETRLYLLDNWDQYVHVFDVSGVPSSAPAQIKDIPLVGQFMGYVSPCLYDCLREGWLNHSTDGHYVFVGESGDVIDTTTNTIDTTVPSGLTNALSNTKMFLEIDFQNGAPSFTTTRYGLGWVTH